MVEHHLDLVLAGASHDGTAAPLLYLDVDTFKHVNGRFGHDADDELLKEVARRLRAAARASDLVVRLGGDEFLIVLGDVPAESAAAVAEGVARRVCQAFERPFDVGGGFTTSSEHRHRPVPGRRARRERACSARPTWGCTPPSGPAAGAGRSPQATRAPPEAVHSPAVGKPSTSAWWTLFTLALLLGALALVVFMSK